jgi:hypothetical protein
MTGRALILLIALLLAPPTGAAAAEKARDQVLLVHVTSLLDGGTDRTALVFRVVAAGLKQGRRVALCFDAEGVLSLKMGRWFGGHSTPIDRVKIPLAERKELAAMLGTTPDGIPDIYGSLLHFLKGRGVSVYASEKALKLRGLWPERYDQAAEPVNEERMLDLLRGAGTYLSY